MASLSRGIRKLSKKGSQSDIAKALGVLPQSVSSWLAGHYRPSSSALLKIEEVFGIPMSDFFSDHRETA